MSEPSNTRLTLEQILAALTEIAQTGTSGERIRALSLLAARETPAAPEIHLPPPMSPSEIVERLARLMRPSGDDLVRLAYRKAFPRSRKEVSAPVEAGAEQLPAETLAKIEKVRDLKSLYRICPELKRPGRPTGYPILGGPLAKQAWCRRAATAYFVEQANRATTAPETPQPPEAEAS